MPKRMEQPRRYQVQSPLLDVTTITDLLIAPYNYSAMDRFKILMDKRVIINRRVVADTDPATGATQEYQQ